MMIAAGDSVGIGVATAAQIARFLRSNDLSKGRIGAPSNPCSGFLFKGNLL